ncbi:hypothetical protein CSKR_203030 [Clonorchis sinensis]|uniref:Uncharacterized protein n=1 Tax=Clonorchis sinensis TaxID=79923 RepID=A0A8T1M6F9_CLOSI|nr:hypothetical protein CSKR_203030 [Clonorchis sinensis]
MRFELPDYVLNRNVITASQRNNVGYLVGLFRRCPWLQDSLFYSEQHWTTLGMLDLTFRPPIVCLFTPFAYAMLSNALGVMTKLVKEGADVYKSCYVVDFIQSDNASEPFYRIQEFPPVALCRPGDPGFQGLMLCGYDVERSMTINMVVQQNEAVEEKRLRYRGYLDFSLGVSKQLNHSREFVEFVKTLFENGYDCHEFLRQVDLWKLFVRGFHLVSEQGFRSIEHRTLAANLISNLIEHGISLKDERTTMNLFKASSAILACPKHTTESKSTALHLLRAVMSLSWNINNFTNSHSNDVKQVLNSLDHGSLLQKCLRAIRTCLGSRFFARKVKKLNCTEETRRMIIDGHKCSCF